MPWIAAKVSHAFGLAHTLLTTLSNRAILHAMGEGTGRETTEAYEGQACKFAACYEALEPERVNAAFADLVPRGTDLVSLDVGAGSGRDAAWLAAFGHEVVAI